MTTYAYDQRSRITSVTDNLGQTVSYVYDDYGQCFARSETSRAKRARRA